MLFRNDTKENVKLRVTENPAQKLYSWKTVRSGKTINLDDEAYGLRLGLTKVEESSVHEEKPEEPKEVEDALSEDKKEEKPEENLKKKRGKRKL